MTSSKIIEVMARALFDRQHNGPFHGAFATKMVFGRERITYDEVVKGIEEGVYTESALSLSRAEAEAAYAAYESHLQASGMAVVPGWQPIETADLALCAHAPCLVTADGAVGEARYFPDQDGWWWADYDPTDYLDRRCFPSHWMPLPPAASPEGKAVVQEASAERSVAHSPNIKAPYREGEQDG